MGKLYCFILFFTISYSCLSQVDTEFWFAPPEVTFGHGDRPIYLRVSTLDQPANVQVIQPARGNMSLANVNVPANTTNTIDLTSQISLLETSSPAQVMKTGIRIISSAPVTAYYEVGATWNTDIFSLKGKNALGNRFVIPAQNLYNNGGDYSPTPYFAFDIVATRNNTVVKVRPSKPLFGHQGDSIITVKLNAGETYSFRKITLLATANPVGTIVEANKPIAITLKDDSVINSTCRDILGDQLVPVEVAGKEYVVLKGFLNSDEYLFITATEDDTEIFVSGSGVPAATLDAGELYRILIRAPSTYILSTKTIYAMHVTGFGCELGMAILPSINCKGSQQIGFSRTTSEFFGFNVLVRKDGIQHFRLNGSSVLVPSSAFLPVPGTNDKWYAAQLSFSTSQIPVGQASLISNNQNSFQIGIINGNETSSCRYGYFSAFSTLFIGDDFAMCEGETVSIDAGPGKESYLWSTGATDMKIDVTSPGTYWVKVEKEECVLYDTISVDVKKGKVEIGPDFEFCEGDTAAVDGKENFSWLWSDGSTERYLKTQQPGKYWVSVFDYTGCQASDTINLSTKPKPQIDLGSDVLKCPNEEILLDATYPGATYQWQDSKTGAFRKVTEAGLYWCRVTYGGCTVIDSVLIENFSGPPQDTIFGSPSVCPFVEEVSYRVKDTSQSTYQWFVNGGSIVVNNDSLINVNWGDSDDRASVKVLVTDSIGCKSDTINYPVRINVQLEPGIPYGPDTLCLNKSDQVVYSVPYTNGSVYNWSILGGEILNGQGNPLVIVSWNTGLNKLWVEETSVTTDTVCSGTSPELPVYVFDDETAVRLNYVSVDTVDENIGVNWAILNTDQVKNDSVYVYRRNRGATDWELIAEFGSQVTLFTDEVNDSDETVYEYYIGLTNLCDETVNSFVHNSIRLIGSVDTLTDVISFTWNHYVHWPEGVDHYELWRKLDDEPGYTMLATVPGTETSLSSISAATGFQHHYVIRAVEKSGVNESWSNNIEFIFEHDVFVPNVFTPNGDEFNQYFEIKKIELYENSELTVMNRWGKMIYKSIGYKNDWDGDGLSTGVYYYILNLNKNSKVLRGTISVLR